MSAEKRLFRKEDMDFYLKELGKELRKEYGKQATFELILVGGGAVALQYEFRDSTVDLDALISSSIRSSINKVADKYNLPNDWLNTDFTRTTSYSAKIREYSKHYRTYGGVLEVRTLKDEYLIAMKTKAFRQYRHDISDIVGIISEMRKNNCDISAEKIERAYSELYGEGETIPKTIKEFLRNILATKDLGSVYQACAEREANAGRALLNAQEEIPPSILEKYLNNIVEEKTEESLSDFLASISETHIESEIDEAEKLWRELEKTGRFASYEIKNIDGNTKLQVYLKSNTNPYIVIDLNTMEVATMHNEEKMSMFTMVMEYPDVSRAYMEVLRLINAREDPTPPRDIEEDDHER